MSLAAMWLAGTGMPATPLHTDNGGMQNYSYQHVHGHIIVMVEGRPLLLDTGVPFSLGYEPIVIAGRSFSVHHSYLGVTPDYLSEHIGTPIEGLIGADILRCFTVSIYSAERLVQFGGASPEGNIAIPLQNFMGIPIITMEINGRVMRALFDTGAPMSYLLPEVLEGMKPEGRHEDFYPLLGHFLTDVHNLDVNIGGERRRLRFGELPEELHPLLTSIGGNVLGILGTGLLRHFAVSLSLNEQVMKLDALRHSASIRAIA